MRKKRTGFSEEAQGTVFNRFCRFRLLNIITELQHQLTCLPGFPVEAVYPSATLFYYGFGGHAVAH